MKPNIRIHPRLFFIDSGLLAHSAGIQSKALGTKDLNESFKGVLAEQQIAQTLKTIGWKPAFWARENRGSGAEVDFLFQHGSTLVPIEAKIRFHRPPAVAAQLHGPMSPRLCGKVLQRPRNG